MNKQNSPDISIALCTYKRNALLQKNLKFLLQQRTIKTFEIIIVDNDHKASAKDTVDCFLVEAQEYNIQLRYFVEPEQGISSARNRSVEMSLGKYIAFIDDDEYPINDWLENLSHAIEFYKVDGVFGPVIPTYPENFPIWLKQSGVYDRKNHRTGLRLKSGQCCTGNALIKKEILKERDGPFNREYGKTGGEDTELFNWLIKRGYQFAWCSSALVYEQLEHNRATLKWNLIRSYRGGWCFAKNYIDNKKISVASLLLFIRVVLGVMKSLLEATKKVYNPKIALFILLNRLSGQVGKLGYLFNIKIEQYKKKPE